MYQPSLLSMQSDDTMWWLSGSAPVALHHHLDWVIRQNYQQYPPWGQIFNKWRLQDMWRVNDVCYYYFNPTELNPCTLYKVLEFVTVEGNFNLVGGDKGIRNTIMARWEIFRLSRQQLDLDLPWPGSEHQRQRKTLFPALLPPCPPHCWTVCLSEFRTRWEGNWGATQELEFIAGLILNT